MVDQLGQPLQARPDVAGDVNPQQATATLGQNRQVTPRLGRGDNAEAGLPAGNGTVMRRVGGDLQEDAAVRAALVGLAGGMQEARAKADDRRALRMVAQPRAQGVDRLDVGRVAVDPGQQADVVAGAGPGEMRAQPAADGLILSWV